MDLLLDVGIIVDVCLERAPLGKTARDAVNLALAKGFRVWIYVGSLQALESAVFSELKRTGADHKPPRSVGQTKTMAKALLKEFCADKSWLAALSAEGNVFDAQDPAGEQLVRALDRFNTGEIALLTNEEEQLKRQDLRILTPEQYLSRPPEAKPIAFIDLKSQQATFRPALEAGIHRVLHNAQYIMGPEIKQLEEKLAEYVGVKHAITVVSGTDSLEIALRALGIGPGDEVITVPFTWISTAEVICQVGARPIFIDIDPATYNMNVDLLEEAITTRTKAIMPVSLFGQMPDYDRINAIATKFNMPVIEDAAQSFGATQRGKRSCGVTRIGSTSFFPAKPFGCYGDGGALFTSDDQLADTMRAIRTHGGQKRHHHPYIGMNGRLDTLQAAVLLAKFPSFQSEVVARGRIGSRYTELLAGVCPGPEVVAGNTHVYAQYTIRAKNRDAIGKRLQEQGIPTAVYYPKCLHEQPAFAHCGYTWGEFPEAEKASREVLSLPMHPLLNEELQDIIVAGVKAAIAL